MGDIGDELSLIFSVPVHFICHIVQIVCQISKLIVCINRDFIVKVASCIFGNSFFYFCKRFVNILTEHKQEQGHQYIDKQEQKLKDKKISASLLVKAAHHIVNGNIAFDSHVVCNGSDYAEARIIFKVPVEIAYLIIGASPDGRIKTCKRNGISRRNILPGTQNNLSSFINDPDDGIGIVCNHSEFFSDAVKTGSGNIVPDILIF